MSESLRKKLTFMAKYSYVFILLLIFLIMSFATDKFLTVDNLLNVARQSSMLLIMALGMTMAMLLGRGVDMSLGAIVSISSCFAAGFFLQSRGWESILLGILAGYAAAFIAGMVDLSGIGEAAWFSLPQLLPFGITFEPSGCIALGLLFAINSIQAIGDLTATTVGGMDRQPTDRELQGGIVAYGVSNILTALLGGLPTATYSQNVGIVATNKVVNRWVFALTGGFLLLAGVVPKFSAVLTTIPQCVLGGATVTVFSTIAMTGMKLIASQDLTARNTTIVGLSAALGVGISQASEALSQFPEAFTMVFGQSPVVIATIMAVLLNLILPKEK